MPFIRILTSTTGPNLQLPNTMNCAFLSAMVVYQPLLLMMSLEWLLLFYDLTGPKVVDMNEVADAFSAALSRKIRYVPLDWDEWKATTLKEHVSKDGWEQHAADHLANLAKLIQNSTVEATANVELLTGSSGMNFEKWVKQHAKEFNEND
jgi:hypothetical protein